MAPPSPRDSTSRKAPSIAEMAAAKPPSAESHDDAEAPGGPHDEARAEPHAEPHAESRDDAAVPPPPVPPGKAAKPGGSGKRSRRPLLVAGVAVLLAAGVAGGVHAVAGSGGGSGRPGAGSTSEPPPTVPPTGPVTNVTDPGQVAPLRRVVPPDVLAVSGGGGSIAPAQIARIAKLGKVRDVVAVAGGAVQLQGRAVNTFAVDPSSFRSWTPPGTAKKTELWAALAADQFVVSTAAAEQLRLSRGFQYPIVARTMPSVTMGGAGSLGLPGIDMLVSRKTGTQLGLVPNVAVMVNAPGADPAQVVRAVSRVLGTGANVVDLNDAKYKTQGDGGRPGSYMDLYRQAATSCPGLSWTVLAAIGQVESDHGRNAGRSSAGALGPMQFMPATWKAYGVDGDRDGKADIMNPYDAVPAAAKYLCANGAGRGGKQLYRAVWHYNHADWYVQKVLGLARAYAARYR